VVGRESCLVEDMFYRSLMIMTAGGLMAGSALAEPGKEIPLWKGTAPGEKGDIPPEKVEKKRDGIERTSNVSAPTLKVFPAPDGSANGAAVLVCPGGGYGILASEHEGSEVCKWLNKNGYTAVLLKYRVPRRAGLAKHHAPVQDVQRAMGMIRKNAAEWKIDANRVGILGFSAGGHLATMSLVNPERTYQFEASVETENCRPDFGILIYPAYLVDEKDASKLAPEVKLDKDCKPVFIAVASDDRWGSSSARIYLELQKLKVPVEMHAFAKGGHGFGITKAAGKPAGTWPELAAKWMSSMGFDQAK